MVLFSFLFGFYFVLERFGKYRLNSNRDVDVWKMWKIFLWITFSFHLFHVSHRHSPPSKTYTMGWILVCLLCFSSSLAFNIIIRNITHLWNENGNQTRQNQSNCWCRRSDELGHEKNIYGILIFFPLFLCLFFISCWREKKYSNFFLFAKFV